MRHRLITIILAAVAGFLAPHAALAGGMCLSEEVCVRFDPPLSTVQVNDNFTVNLVADIDPLVVGWGLDLQIVTPGVISQTAVPAIGLAWFAANGQDGDGLAGLAFPDSLSGPGVVLATLSFQAHAIGETDLLASFTSGDLTEGFAKDPSGFATTTFELGHVSVIPEPSSCLLGLSMLAPLMGRRRLSHSRR